MDTNVGQFSDFVKYNFIDDPSIQLVCKINNIGKKVDEYDNYVPYSRVPWLKYIVIILLVMIYIIPLFCIWRKNNVAVSRARSPLTTSICIILIMLDSIFNTWIFSIDLNFSHYDRLQLTQLEHKGWTNCLLGVWVTTILYLPILVTIYLRIYRIKNVFEVYQKYLGH